jgi:hypothetical protein
MKQVKEVIKQKSKFFNCFESLKTFWCQLENVSMMLSNGGEKFDR